MDGLGWTQVVINIDTNLLDIVILLRELLMKNAKSLRLLICTAISIYNSANQTGDPEVLVAYGASTPPSQRHIGRWERQHRYEVQNQP